MDQPENKASEVASEASMVEKPKAQAKPKAPAKPVDLAAQARNDDAKATARKSLEQSLSPKVAFNDAAAVVMHRQGGGESIRAEVRQSPDGRRFVVIPQGFTAELRTDVKLTEIDFAWKIVPPAIDGALPIDVVTVEDVVYVEARPLGASTCSVFEGDVLVELS